MKVPTVTRKFRLWTYDVWGNARDGFDVNDRYSHGMVSIVCKREVFNADTPHEFETFNPTDRQLSRAASFLGVQWDGEPGGIDPKFGWYPACYTAEATRNGRPIGELVEVQS